MWVVKWSVGGMVGRLVGGRVAGWLGGWMVGRLGGLVAEWVDGWPVVWVGGCASRHLRVCVVDVLCVVYLSCVLCDVLGWCARLTAPPPAHPTRRARPRVRA